MYVRVFVSEMLFSFMYKSATHHSESEWRSEHTGKIFNLYLKDTEINLQSINIINWDLFL